MFPGKKWRHCTEKSQKVYQELENGNYERYQLDATILFIIINNSTYFGHLYAHLQEY
jgi:hypothetical protein